VYYSLFVYIFNNINIIDSIANGSLYLDEELGADNTNYIQYTTTKGPHVRERHNAESKEQHTLASGEREFREREAGQATQFLQKFCNEDVGGSTKNLHILNRIANKYKMNVISTDTIRTLLQLLKGKMYRINSIDINFASYLDDKKNNMVYEICGLIASNKDKYNISPVNTSSNPDILDRKIMELLLLMTYHEDTLAIEFLRSQTTNINTINDVISFYDGSLAYYGDELMAKLENKEKEIMVHYEVYPSYFFKHIRFELIKEYDTQHDPQTDGQFDDEFVNRYSVVLSIINLITIKVIMKIRNSLVNITLEWIKVRKFNYLRYCNILNATDINNAQSNLMPYTFDMYLCSSLCDIETLGHLFYMKNSSNPVINKVVMYYGSAHTKKYEYVLECMYGNDNPNDSVPHEFGTIKWHLSDVINDQGLVANKLHFSKIYNYISYVNALGYSTVGRFLCFNKVMLEFVASYNNAHGIRVNNSVGYLSKTLDGLTETTKEQNSNNESKTGNETKVKIYDNNTDNIDLTNLTSASSIDSQNINANSSNDHILYDDFAEFEQNSAVNAVEIFSGISDRNIIINANNSPPNKYEAIIYILTMVDLYLDAVRPSASDYEDVANSTKHAYISPLAIKNMITKAKKSKEVVREERMTANFHADHPVTKMIMEAKNNYSIKYSRFLDHVNDNMYNPYHRVTEEDVKESKENREYLREVITIFQYIAPCKVAFEGKVGLSYFDQPYSNEQINLIIREYNPEKYSFYGFLTMIFLGYRSAEELQSKSFHKTTFVNTILRENNFTYLLYKLIYFNEDIYFRYKNTNILGGDPKNNDSKPLSLTSPLVPILNSNVPISNLLIIILLLVVLYVLYAVYKLYEINRSNSCYDMDIQHYSAINR
jgi:hypothetical protein